MAILGSMLPIHTTKIHTVLNAIKGSRGGAIDQSGLQSKEE